MRIGVFLIQNASFIHTVCRCASLSTTFASSQSMTSFSHGMVCDDCIVQCRIARWQCLLPSLCSKYLTALTCLLLFIFFWNKAGQYHLYWNRFFTKEHNSNAEDIAIVTMETGARLDASRLATARAMTMNVERVACGRLTPDWLAALNTTPAVSRSLDFRRWRTRYN